MLNCKAASLTVFTTMCPKDQQTNDNLIVKDYCSIIEIFDKFSFSGILGRCLSHLNKAWKEQDAPEAIISAQLSVKNSHVAHLVAQS